MYTILTKVCVGLGLLLALINCGRAPSDLLRQGQLPVNDFPMYITDGADGKVYKLNKDRTKTVLVDGLNDPRGITTDRFNRLYVAEYGAGRLLKVDTESGEYEVVLEDLSSPSIVAVDSFNEVYVIQDGERNIIRVSGKKEIKSFSSAPSALVFGVEDTMIVGLFDDQKVYWNEESTSTEVDSPVNVAIDATGRVYVSEGLPTGGRVLRYHQLEPGSKAKVVAINLQSPMGTAVDTVGNMYVVEQAGGRIILVTHEGKYHSWQSGFLDPQYLTFTKY